MTDRSHLLTEQRLPESMTLDTMSVADAVALMSEQNRVAVEAVAKVEPAIVAAVGLVVASQRAGGRLIYVGAGTSGRLGVLDASECPPTFRTNPEQVQGVIAGGEAAMFRAQEGAEDNAGDGARVIDEKSIGPSDVVLGIAAGGTTPFVHGALRRAAERGAKTVFLSCVQPVANEPAVDIVIRPLTGPEVLTGSTRLKAGTATKLVLNAITTIAMVQLGKVYENLMVDFKTSNTKLQDRAERFVCTLANVDRATAIQLLKQADGHVKAAVLMHRRQLSLADANAALARCGGNLKKAMA
jgi:N-acetylmuramic acid 6-phosphate etherase